MKAQSFAPLRPGVIALRIDIERKDQRGLPIP